MRFFRLDASLRVEGSATRALTDAVEQERLREYPDAQILRRDLSGNPLPPVWPAAVAASMSTPGHARTEEDIAATALAGELVDEDRFADIRAAIPGVSDMMLTRRLRGPSQADGSSCPAVREAR
jgi:FMN-dependent NADH-azoreductase